MPLITREEKGSKLTIQEMDGNLTYLEGLGVDNISLEDKTITLVRSTGSQEIPVDVNAPGLNQSVMGTSEQTGDVVYRRGFLEYSLDEPASSFPISYNGFSIPTIWGRSYYINSYNLIYCLGTTCKRTESSGGGLSLRSDADYNAAATFNIGSGAGGDMVRNIVLQPDGKIIIGGWFDLFNGSLAQYITRLNSDGTRDLTFNADGTGLNSTPRAILLYPNGKLLVGGEFTAYKGTTYNRIIRLNSDGSVDPSFNMGTGFNDGVSGLHIFNDGRILVVGEFTTYKGDTHNRIVMLNSDGSVNNSSNFGVGFDNMVNVIEVQSDGKILIGGWFTQYQENSFNGIVRINPDGTIDPSFNVGTGFTSSTKVTEIETQPDGKILVGGTFTLYNGETANRLIRLNTDGTKDTTFDIGTGFNNGVNVVYVQPDGKILAGGQFNSFNGNSGAKYIIRLNSDGSLDSSFPLSVGATINNWVREIAVQTDGKILLGSWASPNIWRFTAEGVNDVKINPFISAGSSGVSLISTNDLLYLKLSENTDRGILEFEITEFSYKI